MNFDNRVQCTLTGAFRRLHLGRYCRVKSAAQGLLDLSLLFVNVSRLVSVIRANNYGDGQIYYMTIGFIGISITLEVLVMLILCIKERFDLDDPGRHALVNHLNNALLWTIFVSSILHVFAAVFSGDAHFYTSFYGERMKNGSRLVNA